MNTLLPLLVLLARHPASQASSRDAARLEHLYAEVSAGYDSARGGFVTRDGAPLESSVELAFALGREQGDPLWTARARRTVVWMHALYDSAGGGFFLRLKDADPMQQSFDKPTSAIPRARRGSWTRPRWVARTSSARTSPGARRISTAPGTSATCCSRTSRTRRRAASPRSQARAAAAGRRIGAAASSTRTHAPCAISRSWHRSAA